MTPDEFESFAKDAARKAESASYKVMSDFQRGRLRQETHITPALVHALNCEFDKSVLPGLRFDAIVLRDGSRSAAEEKWYGADLFISVSLSSRTENYEKGVLLQAKLTRSDQDFTSQFNSLPAQCTKMLKHSASSFVVNYEGNAMRFGAASRIENTSPRPLNSLCSWTTYRFFLELFRCPIGDARLRLDKLEEFNPRTAIAIKAYSEIDLIEDHLRDE